MTTLEWIIYGSCGIAFLCILIGAINDLRHLKSKTMKYLTQLDEIDQWLVDNFGIIPGACSSTENLRYSTARMIAEALWPKNEKVASGDSKNSKDLEEAAEGMVDKLTIFGIEDLCEITVVMPKAMLNRLGMIGYGYGLYLTKSGKNR